MNTSTKQYTDGQKASKARYIAEKTDYVLAIVHGIVKAVFKPIHWYRSETFIGKSIRYEFDGVMVEDSPFIGLCVWNCVNSKSQNPVTYINI